MRKERHKSPELRPSIGDRIRLAMSAGRQLDGIWIGGWSTPNIERDLARVEGALLLIREHSPLHYSRIINDLERVWVYVLPTGLAAYRHTLKACVLDERYVGDPATSVEAIAATIVHEATHARLERWGIEYKEEMRARIEAICFRRELALAVRLPNGEQLQDDIAHYLSWLHANPDSFRDAQMSDQHIAGGMEMLSYLGAPNWMIRAMLALRALLDRTRRLFRIATSRAP